MATNYKITIKCDDCGRFCKTVDSGIMYGSTSSLEPPDTSYFCQECVDKKVEDPYSVIVGCWWIRPNYISVAKSIIRHYNKH